jgi:anti-sigma28 factor (negative regulator of flagellin synthesis)
MRVVHQNITGASAAETGRASEAQRTGREGGVRTAASETSSGDRVELSNTLGSLARALSSYSSSRASRVQSLEAQYRSGAYKPDSRATSRGMIAEALAQPSQ